jgi:hypothetical protein
MIRLATFRTRNGFDVLRPPLPWLELAIGDGEIAEPHHVE